jgi:hypothetical protein
MLLIPWSTVMPRLLSYALLAATLSAGCTAANGSSPATCGPWEEVDLDQRLGPDAISANDAYALIEGKHVLAGQPDPLIVEITRGAADHSGRSRAQIASPDRTSAALGACGMRVSVDAHVYNASRTIDVTMPTARLTLDSQPHATLETRLAASLPAPYPTQRGLDLAVNFELTRNHQPRVDAQLRLPIDSDPRWTWGK